MWRKDTRYREAGLIACAWIAVFLIVPIFSGSLFWHGNLALCGYCVLFGVAVDCGMQLVSWRSARALVACMFIVGSIALDRQMRPQGGIE